jgi:hypothetical protein
VSGQQSELVETLGLHLVYLDRRLCKRKSTTPQQGKKFQLTIKELEFIIIILNRTFPISTSSCIPAVYNWLQLFTTMYRSKE